MTLIEPQAGTDEEVWARWHAPQSWPALNVLKLAQQPVVVLAAHPDDEVLGIGGLLVQLSAADCRITLVWATDGEASHPREGARLLAAVRRAESLAAADLLGLTRARRVHLGLPDGSLVARERELGHLLAEHVSPHDLLFAPWAGDGHPDHEACGRAARRVAGQVLEYPVWGWHWASPEDPRVPWPRARRIGLDEIARRRKAAAVDCFGSQIGAWPPGTNDRPILPDRVLAHFRRDFEVVLA